MIITGGNSSIVYDEQGGSRVVSTSDDSSLTVQEKTEQVIQKISNSFGNAGTAVGKDLGNIMGNSAEASVRPILEKLQRELINISNDANSVNRTLASGQDDVTGFYTSGGNEPK